MNMASMYTERPFPAHCFNLGGVNVIQAYDPLLLEYLGLTYPLIDRPPLALPGK